MDRNSRSYHEAIASGNAALLSWWFSTIPHTTSLEVWSAFVGLDITLFLIALLARNWMH